MQDGDYGINVFGSGITMVLGHKYAVSGSLTQFSGLTEIAPSSAANVIDLGADTLPTPLTITIENLLGAPEAYEGRLVKIVGLSPAPTNTVIWASGATVTLTDGSFNIDARIQAGSSATTVPFYPAAITGIVGQFDSSNPFTSGYQIMPRSDADVVGTAPASYATWIADAYPGVTDPAIVGFSADADGDGIPNGVEYAFALDPKNGEAGALISQGAGSPFFVPFTHRRAKVLPPPVLIKYQWSTDLIQWYDAGASDTNQNVVTIAEDTVDTSNAAYDIVSGHASRDEGSALKVFIRAKVSN